MAGGLYPWRPQLETCTSCHRPVGTGRNTGIRSGRGRYYRTGEDAAHGGMARARKTDCTRNQKSSYPYQTFGPETGSKIRQTNPRSLVFGQCTELIVKQVERLQEMVQEFSSFAKLPEVHLAPGDVAPLLEEVIALFRNSHSKIHWELDMPDTLPKLAMDQAALHRALLNIFMNAAEALETLPREAPRRVRASVFHDAARGHLRFVITDTGPGLAPDERERMFEAVFLGARKAGQGWGWPSSNPLLPIIAVQSCAVSSQGGGTSIILDFPVYKA